MFMMVDKKDGFLRSNTAGVLGMLQWAGDSHSGNLLLVSSVSSAPLGMRMPVSCAPVHLNALSREAVNEIQTLSPLPEDTRQEVTKSPRFQQMLAETMGVPRLVAATLSKSAEMPKAIESWVLERIREDVVQELAVDTPGKWDDANLRHEAVVYSLLDDWSKNVSDLENEGYVYPTQPHWNHDRQVRWAVPPILLMLWEAEEDENSGLIKCASQVIKNSKWITNKEQSKAFVIQLAAVLQARVLAIWSRTAKGQRPWSLVPDALDVHEVLILPKRCLHHHPVILPSNWVPSSEPETVSIDLPLTVDAFPNHGVAYLVAESTYPGFDVAMRFEDSEGKDVLVLVEAKLGKSPPLTVDTVANKFKAMMRDGDKVNSELAELFNDRRLFFAIAGCVSVVPDPESTVDACVAELCKLDGADVLLKDVRRNMEQALHVLSEASTLDMFGPSLADFVDLEEAV